MKPILTFQLWYTKVDKKVILMKPDRRKYADKLIFPSMAEDSSELAEK